MNHPDLLILYVEDINRSKAFYQSLLAVPAIEASNSFMMFKLDSGLRFGLWSKYEVLPKADVNPGSMEVAILVPDLETLYRMQDDWRLQNIPILQEITKLDFGMTFVGLDPDGHRLRAYVFDSGE